MKPGDNVRWRKSCKVGKTYNGVNGLEVMTSMPFEEIRTIREVQCNGNILLERSPFYYNPFMLIVVK